MNDRFLRALISPSGCGEIAGHECLGNDSLSIVLDVDVYLKSLNAKTDIRPFRGFFK